MSSLCLMRGYPGSGKTTRARSWLLTPSEDQPLRAVVSRDVLRDQVFGGEGTLPYAQEMHLTDIQQDSVRKLLKRGYDVVVDDLNLRRRYAVAWAEIAHEQQVDFDFWNVDLPVDACVSHDQQRASLGGRCVGEAAIRKIAARFPISRWPDRDDIFSSVGTKTVAGSWTPYANPKSLEPIIIVDIDGTVALKDRADGARGWHEYHRVGEDLPNPAVIQMVENLSRLYRIVFLSGRKNSCRAETENWLLKHLPITTTQVGGVLVYMRDAADNRSDDIVKHEIFDAVIRDKYHVVGVFDDRDRVVSMWRAIGLQVYQVAPGNF